MYGTPTKALIDTGSTVSAIDSNFLQRLHPTSVLRPITIHCRTANNGHLQVKGMTTLPILVHTAKLYVNVLVVDDLCANLLLGNNFCNRYDVNLYSGDCFLTLATGSRRIAINYCSQPHQNQAFNITTIQDITIPPCSSRVISASTTAPPMPVFFTPSPKLFNKHFVLAPYALLTVSSDNLTTMTLLNPSHMMITVPKGTTLGQVVAYTDSRCCYTISSCELDTINTIQSGASSTKITKFINFSPLLSHLPSQSRAKLNQVLNRYAPLFDLSEPSVIKTNGVYHRIPVLPHHQPIQSYPYRKSLKERTIINQQVKEMLDNHIIRPSSSPWSSPVVIIQKKDGSPTFLRRLSPLERHYRTRCLPLSLASTISLTN